MQFKDKIAFRFWEAYSPVQLAGGFLLSFLVLWEIHLMTSGFQPEVSDANLRHSFYVFLSGLLVGLLPLWLLKGKDSEKKQSVNGWFWVEAGLLLILFIWGLIEFMPIVKGIFAQYPPTTQHSDIIPQIEVMARRCLEGSYPYAPIHDFGYEIRSPYMPLHWGPFMLSVKWGFEPRWICIVIWCIAGLWFLWELLRADMWWFFKLLLAGIVAAFPYLLASYLPVVYSMTVESMIAAYYLMLGICLLSRKPWLQAIGLCLCLLSRYTIVFWIPLLLLWHWWNGNRKAAIQITWMGTLIVGLLYIIPFLSQNWLLPFEGLEHHQIVTEKNWTFEPWFGPNGKPGILYKGTGLAGFFYEMWPGSVLDRLGAISIAQFGLSFLVLALLGIWAWKHRNRYPISVFSLLSLKLYLVFFFGLLPLPIDYYFILPLCISVALLFAYFRAIPIRA